jgi:hypothetical protein
VPAFKLPSQRSIVVYLPIENELQAFAGIGHWLIRTIGEVDNSEPVVPEKAARILKLSMRVRPPALLNLSIATKPLPIQSGDSVPYDTENSAHAPIPLRPD